MDHRLAVPLLLMLSAVSLTHADSIDDAEAKKRGVPVTVIVLERRVAELERQNKELREQLIALQKAVAGGPAVEAPASTVRAVAKPVVKAEPQWNRDYAVLKDLIDNKLAELAANADANESAAQRQMRSARFDQWVSSTFTNKPVEWTGKILDITIVGEHTVNVNFEVKTSSGTVKYEVLPCTMKPSEAENIARGTEAVLCTRVFGISSDGSNIQVHTPCTLKIYRTK